MIVSHLPLEKLYLCNYSDYSDVVPIVRIINNNNQQGFEECRVTSVAKKPLALDVRLIVQ